MYTIKLTGNEVDTLAWATVRGYFPTETYDAMHLADGEPEDVAANVERLWQIPEHAAWAILTHRDEDSNSLYTCIGGELLEKLIELEQKII